MKIDKPKKDCCINAFFLDCNNPLKEQLIYCENNCRFRCLENKEYEKLDNYLKWFEFTYKIKFPFKINL